MKKKYRKKEKLTPEQEREETRRNLERLVEETETHVLVRLVLWKVLALAEMLSWGEPGGLARTDLLLLFLLGLYFLLGSGTTTSGTTGSWGSSTSGSDVHEQVLDIPSFQSL